MAAPKSTASSTKAPTPRQLAAAHPGSLAQMAWLLPAAGQPRPQLLQGRADIDRDGPYWRVRAGEGTRLLVQLPPATAPASVAATAPATAPAAAPAPAPVPAASASPSRSS